MENLTILLAEDEPDIRDLFIGFLNSAGFTVIGAPDGEEAVNKAREGKPDLVILDIRMPNMTGFEACKIMRSEEATKHIPVIFLSAYGEEANVVTGLQLGAEWFLTKPVTLNDLVFRVKKVLTKYGKM